MRVHSALALTFLATYSTALSASSIEYSAPTFSLISSPRPANLIDTRRVTLLQIESLSADTLFTRIAKTTKDYWFLITLIASTGASLFYMLLYRVTPLDKYREIKYQREQGEFHDNLGYTLLGRGEHELAKAEFEKSLALRSTNYAALNGRYLAELFTDLESPKWNPAVGLTVWENLRGLRATKGPELRHIVEKYLGDLNSYIGNLDVASRHYSDAIALNPNYIGGLFTYGWFSYSRVPDLSKMESLFKKITELDIYDYRGFHGLGYALYMRAVKSTDLRQRMELIKEATQQSQKASSLTINLLNVVADFGEVARCMRPDLSVAYHNRAIEIIDDPLTWSLRDNYLPYGATLITRDGYVYMKDADKKRAWVMYALALDHLALSRLGIDSTANLQEHDRLKQRATELDPRTGPRATLEVYNDQRTILDQFLPVRNASS